MAPGRVDEMKSRDNMRLGKTGCLTNAYEQAKKDKEQHDLVLKTFRLLIADICQQFNGGHPGGAIGMAAIGIALWKYTMRYAPHMPTWFNRDRFVLSNGHACLLQYTFLHLAGYRTMAMEQLRSYHSSREDSLCPGHPEIEIEGVEVTTGPLGQGLANAVGLAIAGTHLGAVFNRPGFEVVTGRVWCVIGDACLQEGVGLEAISLAGHLKLKNLVVVYDNNQITCDGSVDLTNSEDVNAKMHSCGWNVIEIPDGSFDILGIVGALQSALDSDRPTFINAHTVIGFGSKVAGKAEAHGAAFGAEDVAEMKRVWGFNSEEHFVVGPAVRDFFAELPGRGERLVQEWNQLVDWYSRKYPDLATKFRTRVGGELEPRWEDLIPAPGNFPNKATATRASSGLVCNPLAREIDSFIVGTADLSPSVHMSWEGQQDFQHPDLQPKCGITGDYTGRYIHYGIREHAMCAVANGLAAFSPGTIIPVTSSFFMFYLYAAPAVRMGALQHLQVIHAATHDSIGMGEDGPTHQPIELAALYRAMPNILYIRPGDSEETAGAWIVALKARHMPSIISTSRHTIPQLTPLTKREGVSKGAYVLQEVEEDESSKAVAEKKKVLTVIGVGAELNIAVDAAARLREKRKDLAVRLVSFPCNKLFDRQDVAYRRQTLRRDLGPIIAVEPYAAFGWERYADAAVCMQSFGKSLPGTVAYKHFGFDVDGVVGRVEGYLDELDTGKFMIGEFVEV